MAQLSRPYQIGLLAVALLAAAWLLLIQGHSSSSSSASSTPVVTSSSSSPTSSQGSATASTGTHPGSTSGPTAPGVAGLTRAIAKAQGAAKTSEASTKQLNEKSEQASSSTAPAEAAAPAKTTGEHPAVTTHTQTSATAAPSAPSSSTSKTSTAKTAPAPAKSAPVKAAPGAATRTTANQRELAVEAELHRGKIVVILFWNPKGTDDRAVHAAVERLAHSRSGVAVETAAAKEVASFGSITRGVQVYGTPTTLIVNGKGKAATLTGLQDSFGIEQAVQEARSA